MNLIIDFPIPTTIQERCGLWPYTVAAGKQEVLWNYNTKWCIILPPAEFFWKISKEKYGGNGFSWYEYILELREIMFLVWKKILSEVNGIVPMTLSLRNETGDNQEGKKEIKFYWIELFD